MGVRSTNPLQSFIDDFYRSGTDALPSPGAPPGQASGAFAAWGGEMVVKKGSYGGGGGAVVISNSCPGSYFYCWI